MIGGRLPAVTPRQKRKRRKVSRAPSPSKKVHVLQFRRDDALPFDRILNGHGGWTSGCFMVRANVFPFVPKQAQCVRCRARLPPGASRDRDGMTIWHQHATDEQVIAVECFLIGTSRVFAAWADA